MPCSGCRRECSAEFLGTYLLVLIGAGSVVASSVLQLAPPSSQLFVGFAFGGTVAVLILLLGRHSGAQINPAVTIAHGMARRTPTSLIAPYLFFQAFGGVLAGLTLRLFFLNQSKLPANLGSTQLRFGVNPIYGILLEAAGTFLLCLAALTATVHVRSPINQGLLVGGTLFLLILLVGPLTGASFNPARSLGPAISSNHLTGQYVYLLGPILGGLLAAVPFRVRRPRC